MGTNGIQDKIAGKIELTLLKPEATEKDIVALCHQAVDLSMAGVCVHPCWLKTTVRLLHATSIFPVTVIGFPFGAALPEIKVQEILAAKAYGAREVDVVINIGYVKSGQWTDVQNELFRLVDTAHACGLVIKVIVECGLLSEEEKRRAAELVYKSGADYIKTCTGFNGGMATVEDVIHLQAWVGPSVKVKAAGGIRSREQALALLAAGAHRLGTSKGAELVTP